MATKDKRFQLFLFGLHDKVGNSAGENGVSLSTEVRNRVSRSYWQDEVIAKLFDMTGTNFDIADLRRFAEQKENEHKGEMKLSEARYEAWKATQ